MRKKILCLLLALYIVLGAGPALAAQGDGARVVFEGSAPDADGYFQVTMTLYDVTFQVYQFALRYDPAVVQPVDQSGAAAGLRRSLTSPRQRSMGLSSWRKNSAKHWRDKTWKH